MGLALVTGRRINLKGRSLVREALNVESLDGMVRLVRAVLLMTLICEGAGAVLGFPAFAGSHMPLQAVWLSIFHSIASFNNAGFDALGGGTNLIPYRGDVLLNIVTDALVIVGGIGFMVILDVDAAGAISQNDLPHQGRADDDGGVAVRRRGAAANHRPS